jgi:hypothetical protein
MDETAKSLLVFKVCAEIDPGEAPQKSGEVLLAGLE